jgi:bifunctional DNA-binding transcriptional regulator/antitoxin component of YhaV-PrlF toxin-antitoxin module
LVVAYLYELEDRDCGASAPEDERSKRCSQVDENYKVLNSVSDLYDYRIAEVAFVGANLTRDNLGKLRERLNLQEDDTFVLFRQGREDVRAKPYSNEYLVGQASRQELISFINDYFDDYITEAKKTAERERKQRRAEEKQTTTTTYQVVDDYDYSPRVGFGFGSPYYGGYGGYGFGSPFGYGYGRYPYYGSRYGRGYGGFGFGFGI